METNYPMGCGCGTGGSDHGPEPFTANIPCEAKKNPYYRTAFWTGEYLQMTLMSIPVEDDIGLEMHPDTDQYIRVEAGLALVCMGPAEDDLNIRRRLCVGDAVFVPAGTWHNIINVGAEALKLSSVYAPPHHPWGTVHRTKAGAASAE